MKKAYISAKVTFNYVFDVLLASGDGENFMGDGGSDIGSIPDDWDN